MSFHRVITGDCLEVLKTLDAGSIDAVVTDPPYGIGHVAKPQQRQDRSTLNNGKCRDAGYGRWSGSIAGDDKPFDPTPWFRWPCVMLGANYYHERLPAGGWLVWDKKREGFDDWHSADADLAWCSKPCAPRMFRMVWVGLARGECEKASGGQNAKSHHPNQKPVALMRWLMDQAGIPEGATVLDPYCGSGTTGVACKLTGRNFIGIEIDEGYANIARRRIADAASLFHQPEREPEPTLLGVNP